MPIPQLSRKIKSSASWKKRKKKYYINKSNNSARRYKKKRRAKKGSTGLLKIMADKLAFVFIILMILGGLFTLITVAWISRGLPDPNRLMERQVAQSTKIYDRSGEHIIYEIHGDEKRTLIEFNEIPQYLKDATIAIEDKDFYKHGGFSLWAMFRTAITNVLYHKKAGGSTLTQQLIKNAVLSPEKTYTRKIKELLLAYKVEKKFSKDEILQMYLNEIPYGSTAYGVEAASRRYFGKSANSINLAEAAILAALPQAPTRYSPYGSRQDELFNRQHYILDLMAEQKYITAEDADIAKAADVEFKEQSNSIIAPHFVMYIKELLAEKYGEKMIEQEGWKIYTTLDLYKQEIAEQVIQEKCEKNRTDYNAWNAAMISIDPKTGQVLAMVGSKDYFGESEPEGCVSGKDCKFEPNDNVAIRGRQPGSSLKPMVYAAAFEKGYTPDTILYDVVTNFSNNPDEPYEPHNYDSEEHGPVTVRKALAGSLNIPAVKAIYLAGIDKVLDLADSLGYTTLKDRSRFGLSLVLGGGEVKLIEHVNAYSAFAREGILHPVSAILKIEDKNGKIIEEYKEEKGKKAIDAKAARLINNILSDNAARAYAFGEKNWLTLGSRPVAAKTGTTDDYRDAWTIGYTPSIVTGVWVGNNNNEKMERGAAGGTVAAPIWHDYMKQVLGDTPVEHFKTPEKIVTGKAVLDGKIGGEIKIKIDRASGLLATEWTPDNMIEEKIFNQHHSILYYINKDNPLGGEPKDPAKDPQFELWENVILEWAKKREEELISEKPPAEYDNLHKQENRPTFIIESPVNNQAIIESLFVADISASAPRGIGRAEYYIDDNLLSSVMFYPFNLSQKIDFLKNGFHNLKVRVCDDVDNCLEKTLEFNLILDENIGDNNIDLSFINPSSGLALNNLDFPLEFKINVVNPTQTAKIKFYYLEEGNGEPQYITIAQPINSNVISAQWQSIPASGVYKIYAESYGWNGQFVRSEEVVVIVANIESITN